MSDYIVTIIPATDREVITQECLDECVDVIIETLYRKILQGTNGFTIQDWQIEDVWNQIEVKRYDALTLVAPTLTDSPAYFKNYLKIVCNVCQKDVGEWWFEIMDLDESKQESTTSQIEHTCPCGKTEIDLTKLDYKDNPMYYVRYQIRVWHLFDLLTEEERQELIRRLETINKQRLLVFEGNY